MAICFSQLSIYNVGHPWSWTLRPSMFSLPKTIVLALHLSCYYVISVWSRESNVSNFSCGYAVVIKIIPQIQLSERSPSGTLPQVLVTTLRYVFTWFCQIFIYPDKDGLQS